MTIRNGLELLKVVKGTHFTQGCANQSVGHHLQHQT